MAIDACSCTENYDGDNTFCGKVVGSRAQEDKGELRWFPRPITTEVVPGTHG